MTVAELRNILAELDSSYDYFEIVMAIDSEGNDFSPLAAVDSCHYVADSTWSGYIVSDDDDDDDLFYDEEDEDEEDEEKEPVVPNAFCLWPVH